jgi:hypothetical protein
MGEIDHGWCSAEEHPLPEEEQGREDPEPVEGNRGGE